MIDLNRACEIAIEYFYKEQSKSGIRELLDTKEIWIFYGGNPDEVEIGDIGIKVNKNDGTIEPFILPSPENFALLDSAVEICVPQEFQAK